MLKVPESDKIYVHNNNGEDASLVPSKFNKLPSNVLIVKPGIHQSELDKEYDIYLFDRLANQLFGIKDLSLYIDKIKKLI